MFEESLEKLNTALSKDAEVLEVFSWAKNKASTDFYHNEPYDLAMIMKAMVENLQMLQNVEFYDVNASTRDVLEAAGKFMKDVTKNGIKECSMKLYDCIVETASRLVIFCVTCRYSKSISTLIDENLDLKAKNKRQMFFRGHSDSSYKLIPSIYRGLKVEDGFDIIKEGKLRMLYDKCHITERYLNIFGTDKIDYAFCAFAQHSKAYSPFLDFTEDVKIALSFATYNTSNLNNYYNKKAALISISFEDDLSIRDSVDMGALSILVSNRKLTQFSKLDGKPLCICTYNDFKVEAFLLKDKTNDRMKYQKGCFLYFQKCVIVNGKVLMPVNFGRINKYIIPAEGKTFNKQNIYRTISEKYLFYKYEFLMNPYKYFEEAPFI